MTAEKVHNNLKEFKYKQGGYLDWVKNFGKTLNCEVNDNALNFSECDAGTGYVKGVFLENGLTACINDYQLNVDYRFNRLPSDKFGVIIYLYHFDARDTIEYTLENVSFNLEHGNHYALRVINSQTTHQFKFSKTTSVRGISIFLENEWIEKNISHRLDEVFLYLKEVNYFRQFINAKQQRLLNEILDMAGDQPYNGVYVKSRLYRILDKLFENFLLRDISESPEKISDEDFKTLQKIELILTNSFDKAFPGIEKLSRISLMSESKLKKLFKQSFGMGLYEYFQKNRMHRAKEFILSAKYTISEVGTRLGYQNLSNFSVAFRKEFHCLPSEIVLS